MGVHIFDVCLAGFALYFVGRLVSGLRRKTPLPPGPPGWPIIGNLVELLIHAPYKESLGPMSRKYGKYPLTQITVSADADYARPCRIPENNGHAIRRSQFLQDDQRLTREEERYYLEQATLDDGRRPRRVARYHSFSTIR